VTTAVAPGIGDRLVLLTPGPVMVSPRVREALASAQFSHREPAFGDLLIDVRRRLLALANAGDHEALVLAGSATAAIEAAFATLLTPGETLLVASNGAFGERLAEIAEVLGIRLRHLRQPWGRPLDCDEIGRALAEDPAITSLAIVHHDTSVGCLNPVAAIGAIAAERGARFFVDVVSSFGAEEFDASAAHASVIIGAPNKCLESVAGAAFVLVRRDAWRSSASPRTLYLDLRRYRAASPQESAIPFTPAVPAVVALHEALAELEDEGGPEARRLRYLARQSQIRRGLARVHIAPYFDGTSCSLTVAALPPATTSRGLYDELRTRGFVVYEAKGELREHCFLVANMGHLQVETVERFLDAVADVLQP
jgi:2-aminoethylphosphonate-pyruvate transaminase